MKIDNEGQRMGALQGMREGKTGNAIAGLVVFFFSWMQVSSAVAAVKEELNHPTKAEVVVSSPATSAPPTPDTQQQLQSELLKLQAALKPGRNLIRKTTRKDANGKLITDITIVGSPRSGDVKAAQSKLGSLAAQLRADDTQALAQFKADEQHIREHKLPAVILERQQQALASFQARSKEMQDRLAELQRGTQVAITYNQTQGLLKQLDEWRPKEAKFDPKNLPFRVVEDKARRPITDLQEMRRALEQPISLQQVSSVELPSSDRRTEISALQLAEINAAKHGYPIDRGSVLVAGPAVPIPAPAPEYLAETKDAPITAAIREKALELHNNPVEIYNWVRNSIAFVPVYGSVQGAANTLRTKQGNAFDTSSLLIALLRASGTPARYAYGSVEIPSADVQNWLGGVPSTDIAQQLLGQGGIPNTGLASRGKIVAVRLEHVWVEAWVDFTPSRGAINNQGDAWVPLDASYKKNRFGDGIDVFKRPIFSGLDSLNAFTSQIQFNAQTGALTGVDYEKASAIVAEARGKFREHLTTLEDEGHDPVRVTTIVSERNPTFAGSLPYRLASANPLRFAELPSSLRRQFEIVLYSDSSDSGSPAIQSSLDLLAIGSKRLNLRYVPATEADREALESALVDKSAAGETIEPNEIRRLISAYSIRMVPQLVLEDEIIASSSTPMPLGQEVRLDMAIQTPSGRWLNSSNTTTVGEFHSLVFSLEGAGSDELLKRVQQEPASLLHEAGVSYWANMDGLLDAMSMVGVGRLVRQPSFGRFSTLIDTQFRYGIPFRVSFGAVGVDVDAAPISVVSFDPARVPIASIGLMVGSFGSSMESDVPPIYLSSRTDTSNGFSAVSIVGAALRAGQPLYFLTAENVDQALQEVSQSSEIESIARSSAEAGLQVIMPASPVQIGLWRGGTVISEDPVTGSGAYQISGGTDGGGSTDDPGSDETAKALSVIGMGVFAGALVVPAMMAAHEPNVCDLKQRTRVPVSELIFLASFMTFLLVLIAVSGGGLALPVASALRTLMPLFLFISAGAANAAGRGCTTYVSGATARTGNSMLEQTQHVASSGKAKTLTYRGIGETDLLREELGQWYNEYPQCNAAARAAYRAEHGESGDCDEYPYLASFQGGPPNDVSLKLINPSHNRVGGGTLPAFFMKCGVGKGEAFEVETSGGVTRGKDSQGAACY